jgi:hypothetical protein
MSTVSRYCARPVQSSPAFSLIRRLPSSSSARLPAFVRNLHRYYATVRLPGVVHEGRALVGSPSGPPPFFFKTAGDTGISWFPCIEFPCMHGVCDPAEPLGIIAISIPSVLPSASPDGVGAPNRVFSGLNTQPACAPVNASRRTLRYVAHDSGSEWFAIPSLYDSFLHYSTPVFTSAPGENAYFTRGINHLQSL